MVEVNTEGMNPNVVALAGHGKIDHNDYERVIVPAIEEKIKTQGKVRVLYQLGEDFKSYSGEALWDDAKLGMRHYSDFERPAVVTNVKWIRDLISIFRFMIPCPTKLFHNDELPLAVTWINE